MISERIIEIIGKGFRDFGSADELLACDIDDALRPIQAGLALGPNVIDDKVFDEESEHTREIDQLIVFTANN